MKSGLFVSKSSRRGLLNERDSEPVRVNSLQQAISSNCIHVHHCGSVLVPVNRTLRTEVAKMCSRSC